LLGNRGPHKVSRELCMPGVTVTSLAQRSPDYPPSGLLLLASLAHHSIRPRLRVLSTMEIDNDHRPAFFVLSLAWPWLLPFCSWLSTKRIRTLDPPYPGQLTGTAWHRTTTAVMLKPLPQRPRPIRVVATTPTALATTPRALARIRNKGRAMRTPEWRRGQWLHGRSSHILVS
jgi:hypothetical protein